VPLSLSLTLSHFAWKEEKEKKMSAGALLDGETRRVSDQSREAVIKWLHSLVCRESVVKHWAELRVRRNHLQNAYKIIKVVAGKDVHFVLSAQYIQLFGDRYPFMRLQRNEAIIGGTQVNLALNFETYHKRYFNAPPLSSSLTGTPLYTRFVGDRFFPQYFPRAAIVRGIVAQMLVAAEKEGMFYPMVFLLKAALRKAFVKTKAHFLLAIEAELLQRGTLDGVVARCHQLAAQLA